MKKPFWVKWLANGLWSTILHRVVYINKGNIDFNDIYIYAANHIKWDDAAYVLGKIDSMAIMAKEELFKNPFVKFIMKNVGAFPVARGKKDHTSLLTAINVIKKEKASLFIFPEGTRHAKAKKAKAHNGVTCIAAMSKTKVVPVYISERRPIFGKMYVVFGEPMEINLTKEEIKDKGKIKECTNKIMEGIYNLEKDEQNERNKRK